LIVLNLQPSPAERKFCWGFFYPINNLRWTMNNSCHFEMKREQGEKSLLLQKTPLSRAKGIPRLRPDKSSGLRSE